MDIFNILNSLKFSEEEKNNLYFLIRDILNTSSSKEEASMILVKSIEDLFLLKIEELKEKTENTLEGNFSNNKKNSFRRAT